MNDAPYERLRREARHAARPLVLSLAREATRRRDDAALDLAAASLLRIAARHALDAVDAHMRALDLSQRLPLLSVDQQRLKDLYAVKQLDDYPAPLRDRLAVALPALQRALRDHLRDLGDAEHRAGAAARAARDDERRALSWLEALTPSPQTAALRHVSHQALFALDVLEAASRLDPERTLTVLVDPARRLRPMDARHPLDDLLDRLPSLPPGPDLDRLLAEAAEAADALAADAAQACLVLLR